MPLSDSSNIKGTQRVFSIVEKKRVGSALLPTGVSFKWSNGDFTAPRGSWQFGLQLRTVRKDLPGSEDPVEHVLGWNYSPFSISGVWDDRKAGSGYAVQTWRDFEALVKRGNFVEIQFEQVAITGLITKIDFNYKRKDYIGYSIAVSPHKRYEGETVRQDVNSSRRVTLDPAAAVAKARAGLEDLQRAHALARAANLSQVQQLLGTGLFATVDGIIDDLAVSITDVEGIVNKEILKAQEVANSFSRAVQTMATIKTKITSLLNATQHAVSTANMAIDSAVSTLQYESWIRGMAASSRLFANATGQAQQDISLRANAKPRRLHRARQGESLYAISNLYYGTPHQWRRIMTYNKLPSLVLAGGELLVIPTEG